MTDREISIMATEYAKLADPLNQTLEKQADIRMGFVEGFKQALRIHDVVSQRELLLDFAEYSENDKTSTTIDECVDNYLDSIKQ